MNSTALQPKRIVATIELLNQRIEERFPDAGLKQVCTNVLALAKNMESRAVWIGRPVVWLRLVTWLVVAAIVTLTVGPFTWALLNHSAASVVPSGLPEMIQLMEAAINDVLLIGAAIFFLLTVETRYKRKRALEALHEIRSLAHVIDMHQLTKDPHRILGSAHYRHTTLSPKMNMSRFELHRYLDYCSEMLALLGKIAAVYVQEFDDGVALASAAEIETLTTGLSSKIWQKIAILSTVENQIADGGSGSVGVASDSPLLEQPGTMSGSRSVTGEERNAEKSSVRNDRKA